MCGSVVIVKYGRLRWAGNVEKVVRMCFLLSTILHYVFALRNGGLPLIVYQKLSVQRVYSYPLCVEVLL